MHAVSGSRAALVALHRLLPRVMHSLVSGRVPLTPDAHTALQLPLEDHEDHVGRSQHSLSMQSWLNPHWSGVVQDVAAKTASKLCAHSTARQSASDTFVTDAILLSHTTGWLFLSLLLLLAAPSAQLRRFRLLPLCLVFLDGIMQRARRPLTQKKHTHAHTNTHKKERGGWQKVRRARS